LALERSEHTGRLGSTPPRQQPTLLWFGESLNNWRVFNQEQATHDGARVSWGRYLLDPDFWEKTLQNWQSEFLAVGTMVVFTIYLRQRGSPESKPVGAPHDETATSG
jgi:Domain of unknown function (DUF6766)